MRALCSECRFFSRWPDPARLPPNYVPSGDCRKRSPTVRTGRKNFATGETDANEPIWPPVFADDWCGDFRGGEPGSIA